MTWKTYARQSATMPQGITLETSRACLNALLVVCHGWREPARELVHREGVPGALTTPLLRWTRPAWRSW